MRYFAGARRISWIAAAGLLASGCGNLILEEMPTVPDATRPPTPGPRSTVTPKPPRPPRPTEQPTEEPTPDPTPTPTKKPNPGGKGCGDPVPPPLAKFNLKVHLYHIPGSDAWVLDSTPLVGPSQAFCALIGYTDKRSLCSPRPFGHPEREACEAMVVGRAEDTGKLQPTWMRNGKYCTGEASGCERVDNPFYLYIYKNGTYRIQGENGVFRELVVDNYK